MKIAQVTQHYLPIIGGQEVYIENLLDVFRARGWENQVFQPSRGCRRSDVVNVWRIPKIGGVIPGSEPYVFNFFLGLMHGRALSKADVIISHYAFHSKPLMRFRQRTIVLSHGVEWHLENMTWDDREHERRARFSFDLFTHVVNDTHYLRHMGLNIPAGRGFFEEVAPGKWFIPNCVDGAVFKRTPGIPALLERQAILVPRQIVVDRGIHLAIEAFRNIADARPDLSLHILGKIRPGPYIRHCRDLVKRLELDSKVVFQDQVQNANMADFYSSSVLTLIPTLRREGTSLSALESMACGTATVSTDVAGLRDLPTVQCAPTAEHMAEVILRTLPEARRIGNEQAETVRRTFNLENWSTAWCKVVSRVGGKSAS